MNKYGWQGKNSTRWKDMLKKDQRKKCKHGKDTFCCQCEYGESHNQRDFIDTPIDAVEEMNRNHAR